MYKLNIFNFNLFLINIINYCGFWDFIIIKIFCKGIIYIIIVVLYIMCKFCLKN